MTKTLQVLDCRQSSSTQSTQSLLSPFLFRVRGKVSTKSITPPYRPSIANTISSKTDTDMIDTIDDLSASIDSTIQAWSEDGHYRHIQEKKVKRSSKIKNRRRSTPVVNGTLISSNVSSSAESALLRRRDPSKLKSMLIATPTRESLKPRFVASPSQMSTFSSMASPLNKFPTAPSRSSSGSLTEDTGTPTTARPNARVPSYHGLRNGPLVIKNRISEIPQLRIDDITLDTESLVASSWMVDGTSQGTPSVSNTELIDNLLTGVQESGRPQSTVFSEIVDDDAGSEWGTEDGDMTPRLRSVYEEPSPEASSEFSLVRVSSKSSKRQSIHYVGTPRLICGKSKYYPRPSQDTKGARGIAQQHLQGARGKYWSPQNAQAAKKAEATLTPRQKARHSTRFQRRSGQIWVQPKTLELTDALKVTVYPPEIDTSHLHRFPLGDQDRTPTQAHFKRVSKVVTGAKSSSSSFSSLSSAEGRPRIPPPSGLPPPVPSLGSRQLRRSSAKRGNRPSLRSSMKIKRSEVADSQRFSSCSCVTQTEACSCTCSTVESTVTDCVTCTCSGSSECSCSASRMSVIGPDQHSTFFKMQKIPPRSAQIDRASKAEDTWYSEAPQSAPYYSSLNPPVLKKLPQFSPFHIDFSHIFGIHDRRSKRFTRLDNRISIWSCSTCTSGTTCTGFSRCSECIREGRREAISSNSTRAQGVMDLSDSPWYDTIRSASTSPLDSPGSDGESSGVESAPPLTPPRSEYMGKDSVGIESPGYRYSYVVSPMSSRSSRRSKVVVSFLYDGTLNSDYRKSMYVPRSIAGEEERLSRITNTTTTKTAMTSKTITTNTSKAPRSILKTSSRYEGGLSRRVSTRKSSTNTATTRRSITSFRAVSQAGSAVRVVPQHITIEESALAKTAVENRIQREERRRARNESRLYALDRLEGVKAKKAGLLLQLTNSTKAAMLPHTQAWAEEEIASATECSTPQTSLTDAHDHLHELQRQYEIRQQALQLQRKKDTLALNNASGGFDMGAGGHLKIPQLSRKKVDYDAQLKTQIKSLSNSIEARLAARERCIDV